MISWEDFEKVDIRTGTILEVTEFPKARKAAWQLQIDFGELGIKKSSAQIVHHYAKEDLIGKQIIAVVNFPPKQIANFFSECLILGVSDANGNIVLLETERAVPNGHEIS
tara:strand:+ start:934 stop:1263 length:330 start_codon:yes stop_codon:yes gene_type:complete